MAKRSLKASTSGARLAKQQFTFKGWTQEYLASEVGIKTRQPIWRFFAGQPIERYTFFEICTALDLEWREVASNAPAEYIDRTVDRITNNTELEPTSLKLDDVVQMVRSQRKDKVNHQCGILQLLDIGRPVELDKIYIDVNAIEQIPSQQGIEISDLDSLAPEDIDRFDLDKITARQILGTEAVEKYGNLRVLGKTGSGKSIFLKHLAMQCNAGRFAANQVPMFMTLRDFAESYKYNQQLRLLEFIHQEFLESDISHPETLKKLLHEGRILFLIDGIDEICQDVKLEHRVLNEVRRFCERYHKNTFVTTCRTALQKLTLKGFTDVQITPLNEDQISAGARKWFGEFSKADGTNGLKISSQFMQELKLPENWQFQSLMTTPLFLHLACSIFHRQKKFPIKADFYKQGMDLLVWKWDEARGMDRNQSYPGFALPQKLQLWSEIASFTFEKGQYFFEQRVIEEHIANSVQNLTDTNSEPEELYQAIEAVLRMVKSQHHGLLAERARGIFSFSYSAMQQYCIARKIVAGQHLQPSGQSLQELVTHLTDPRWHEIFLLTASMLHSSDDLVQLMKQEINRLVAESPYLENFLAWAYQKSQNNLETSPDSGERKTLHSCDRLSNKNHMEPNLENWSNNNCMTRLWQLQQAIANRENVDASKQQVLQSFYDANQLLLDCLNSSCEVTSSIREEIEANLLCYSYCRSSYSKLSSNMLPMEV
ncbi:MAG: NTPase (NACHT family) [Pseudanabaena frigida]|uniref:NTPase (NACHT family) n=1 Tax=Pseudanabaena frigida TaxID=945775 RepID=A0A2W4WIK6_9CYAN|nr:MAG: NTPase (NACHT family) [Pseudanabaena frigida]